MMTTCIFPDKILKPLLRSGEGVAEFASRSDMEYALDKLDGSELGGRRWVDLYQTIKS